METLQKPLKDVRFDIYERVRIDGVSENIFSIIKTELPPHIKMLMRKDEIQFVGYLQLNLIYKDSGKFLMQHEYQHKIAVEIKIPASRVRDAYLLDADIENFNVEIFGSSQVNVTGVLVVYEKEEQTVSDKVKLPRDVAEEVAAIMQHESYPIKFVIDVFESDIAEPSSLKSYFETDRSRRIENVMKAIIIGYEVEQTPEDKVREYYLSYEREQHWTVCNHIKSVLELLGITIEGVNA